MAAAPPPDAEADADAGIRALLGAFGDTRPQAPAEWNGPFPLPEVLAAYYRDIGPLDLTVDGYGNPFFLPALARLWEYQAGYRWNGVTNEPIADWPDDWLVVADQGADPFILERSTGKILFAQHGAGAWDAGEIFGDLPEMAACLGTLGRVVRDAGEGLFTDDYSLSPAGREDAVRRLAALLGSDTEADALLGTLGWG